MRLGTLFLSATVRPTNPYICIYSVYVVLAEAIFETVGLQRSPLHHHKIVSLDTSAKCDWEFGLGTRVQFPSRQLLHIAGKLHVRAHVVLPRVPLALPILAHPNHISSQTGKAEHAVPSLFGVRWCWRPRRLCNGTSGVDRSTDHPPTA